MKQGHEIACLVTVVSGSRESYMYHVPAIGMTELMAEAIGVPRFVIHTEGEKEKELEPLRRALATMAVKRKGTDGKTSGQDPGRWTPGDAGDGTWIEGIVSGAVESEYQRSRLAGICEELGIECLTPLWHTQTEDFLTELVGSGYEIMISGVFAHGLDESLLGKIIDEGIIEKFRVLNRQYRVSMVGEGGEFETAVLAAPFYRKRVVVDEMERVWERDSGYVVVKRAHLEDK